MENVNNIKTRNKFIVMRQLIMLSIILLAAFVCGGILNSYAENGYVADEVLNWKFEEGDGAILLDSSGNGYPGIKTGATFDAGTKKFGNYALKFDGNDDFAESSVQMPLSSYMTISVWLYKEAQADERSIWFIENNDKEHFKLIYNHTSNTFVVMYECSDGNDNYINIPGSSVVANTWNYITVQVNYINNSLLFYRGNTLLYNQTQPANFTPIDNNNYLILGKSITGLDEMKGRLDEFRYFNFLTDSSQIASLIATNTIEFNESEIIGVIEDEEPTDFDQDLTLISSNYPYVNSTIQFGEDFTVNLNRKASCEIYIDSALYAAGSSQISYSFPQSFKEGNYSMMIYCYYTIDGTQYFQLKNFEFEIAVFSPSLINFYINGLDYEVNDASLYIVTPCIKRVINVGEVGKDGTRFLNENGLFYWQEVVNGQAQFNLTEGVHEFCLVNGLVQYSQNGFTTDFNINDVDGLTQLGEYDVPSNVTQSYSVQTELLDIYDNIDPKAYGKTWAGILASLFFAAMGTAIVFVGLANNNGKIVVAGVLLFIIALGGAGISLVTGVLF